jgi:hypothetical protein
MAKISDRLVGQIYTYQGIEVGTPGCRPVDMALYRSVGELKSY